MQEGAAHGPAHKAMPLSQAVTRARPEPAGRWAKAADEGVRIDASLELPAASARIVHFDLGGPREDLFRNDGFWLDLSLSPRPPGARGRFLDRWGPDHFRRVGALALFPPGEPLQFKSEGGVQSALVCEVRSEAVSQWLDRDFAWSSEKLEATLEVSDPNVQGLLLRLGREMRKPGFASELLTEMMIGQLALEVGRYCAAIEHRKATRGGLPTWRLRRIDERLADMASPPTLTELAELCGLSVRQLTRGFRASRGCSLAHYAAGLRLDAAKERLRRGDSIGEVAVDLGFASSSIFIQAFRRHTGLTPGAYRAQAPRRS